MSIPSFAWLFHPGLSRVQPFPPGLLRSHAWAALATGVMLLGTCVSPAFAQATFIPIDNVPGAESGNYVISLSADGTAVTGQAFPVGGGTSAFRWTLGGGTVDLGNPAGGNNAVGTGISGDGSVIATTEFSGGDASAFRWTSGGGFQSIGQGHTSGISADGSGIVGTSSFGGDVRAFRWTSGSGMQSLGALPGGAYSEATGVSGDASVVVGVSESVAGFRAFRWTSAGGMQSLGVLDDGTGSIAFAVSGDGSSATGSSSFEGGAEAFRWTDSGGMQGLGILDGLTFSEGYGISGDGSAIVGGSGSDFEFAAFLWTAETGMLDLNTYLPTLGVDLTGWTLEFATGISFDGRTIAGNGVFNGESRSWVVTNVPAPTASALFGLGGLLALRRRRKSLHA